MSGEWCSIGLIYLNGLSLGFYLVQSNKTAPQESAAQWFSFEWSHFQILSTDLKVRTTLTNINMSQESIVQQHSFE